MSHPACPTFLCQPDLGRAARTDPSRLCLSSECERAQEGAFPAAGPAPAAGTLTLLALRQRGVPPGGSPAGAAAGAPQGVARAAGDAHGVPCPVVIAARGHGPVPHTWERAQGSWGGRREMLTCRAAGSCPAAGCLCSPVPTSRGGCSWGGGPWGAEPSLCSSGTPLPPQLTKSACPGFHVSHPAFPGLSAGSEATPKGPIRPGKTRTGQLRTDPKAPQGSVLCQGAGEGAQPGLGVPAVALMMRQLCQLWL